MVTRYITPTTRHFNKDTKAVLSGGQMFFFEPGSTTAPKDTFSDLAGLIPNTNPVILSANGLEPPIFGEGSYRVVLTSQFGDDIEQWVRDPVNLEDVTANTGFSDWLSTIDYAVNDLVEASDGNFYLSIQTPNINNDPTGATAAFWTEFDLLKRFNTNETYDIGDTVTQSNTFYISLTASNQGNDPSADNVNWESTAKLPTSETFTTSGTWNKPVGLKYIVVEVHGPGGGGGSSGTTLAASGGGGGGGGYARKIIDTAVLAATVTVTIATPGAGGVASAGGNSVSTIFVGHISAGGGQGGARGGAGQGTGGTPGAGGNPGDFRVQAQSGQEGNQNYVVGARGGDTFAGFGGYGELAVGTVGFAFGGGGSAGLNDGAEQDGSAGAVGLCTVTNYFQ